ncbi:MAG: hypothetical protein JST87_05710 [Bacteroidetes bacterium]|nr:hypothetical protein [Bacteroidota bacterium]MBS1932925.1 hypothetical protein [Bacteroidota bacterium]
MKEKTKKPTGKKLSKKQAAQEIFEKLAPVLAEYKTGNSKKFDRRLMKASKLFAPLVIKEKSGKK